MSFSDSWLFVVCCLLFVVSAGQQQITQRRATIPLNILTPFPVEEDLGLGWGVGSPGVGSREDW